MNLLDPVTLPTWALSLLLFVPWLIVLALAQELRWRREEIERAGMSRNTYATALRAAQDELSNMRAPKQ